MRKYFITLLLLGLTNSLFGQSHRVTRMPKRRVPSATAKPRQAHKSKPKPATKTSPKPSIPFYKPQPNPVIENLLLNMVYVKGGTFTMGATPDQGSDYLFNEIPVHQVTLSDYCIGKYEVTQEEWEVVMGSNPSEFKGSRRPVENVSWEDCQEFIRKLNAITGQTFRLPTEAEWEYAARGGTRSRGEMYAGGNTISSVAWYTVNSYDKGSSNPDYGTHPVGQKQPNELGLYDMSGNVWEWCSDWYFYYDSRSQTNPKGPSSGTYRVSRGGSWGRSSRCCRVSYRHDFAPSIHSRHLGLRLVR